MSAPTALLASDEPDPVVDHNPAGRSAYFLTADHYGRLTPRALGDLGVAAPDWDRHIACDIGIAGVATKLSDALGAHLLGQRYSRLVIDCNRPLHAESSIPAISEATRIPGNENLPEQARQLRQHALFVPYHGRIDAALDRRAREQRPTMLIALHSFTPVYHGIARPWHIGTLYEHDTRLAYVLLRELRKETGLVVGDNEPYAVRENSDYTIPMHGARRGLLHTGIEIRQDLIASEQGQAEWAERLARIFRLIEPEVLRLV